MEGKRDKIIFIVIIFIVLIITLAIMVPKFPLFVVKKTFNYAVYHIVNISGLSQWLVKGILVFALMPFYWALMEISMLNITIFKRQKRHRKLAKFIIFGYSGLFFLTMFFLSRDTYFQHYNGAPTKYYAVTPEGIRFFDSPGYDPKYGIKLQPVTPDIINKYQRNKLGFVPNKINIDSPKDYQFFNPITGEPKVWYYKDENGIFEFFNGPGFHPVFNQELKPVTKEILAELMRKIEEAKQQAEAARIEKEKKKQLQILDSYIDKSLVNQKDVREASLIILDENRQELPGIESLLNDSLRAMGIIPKSIFRKNFINEGIFENIFSGQTKKLVDLKVYEQTDYVILGKKKCSYEINQDLSGVITATLSLDLRVYSAKSGELIASTVFREVGAGFSQDEAEKRAIESLNEKISEFVSKWLK